MKIFRKRLSIVLLLTIFIMSFELIGVSAIGEEGEKTAPAAVENLEAHAGYNSAILTWDRVEGADGYVIYKEKDDEFVPMTLVSNTAEPVIQYKVGKLKQYETYAFKVTSYVNDVNAVNGKLESKRRGVKAATVRGMTYLLTLRAPVTLTSHTGGRKKLSLKKGEIVEATHFSQGQYIFFRGGRRYHINRIRANEIKPVYKKKDSWDYSRTTAESLVNEMKLSSKTKRLVWVSTYTQHAYYFKGSKGKWKCVDDWECATGKAKSPTPTGYNGKKSIWSKIRTRHGVPWWSPFSSLNSLHGADSDGKMGAPASGGCVRNPNKKAEKLFNDAKIGTTVLIY